MTPVEEALKLLDEFGEHVKERGYVSVTLKDFWAWLVKKKKIKFDNSGYSRRFNLCAEET